MNKGLSKTYWYSRYKVLSRILNTYQL